MMKHSPHPHAAARRTHMKHLQVMSSFFPWANEEFYRNICLNLLLLALIFIKNQPPFKNEGAETSLFSLSPSPLHPSLNACITSYSITGPSRVIC